MSYFVRGDIFFDSPCIPINIVLDKIYAGTTQEMLILNIWVFLAPPAERQCSFSNTKLSVVCLSVRQDWGGRAGVNLRNASVTFSLFWYGASVWWHKSHIERWIWLNRSKGNLSRSERSNFAHFALLGHLLQNCSVTFSLFWHRAAQEGY